MSRAIRFSPGENLEEAKLAHPANVMEPIEIRLSHLISNVSECVSTFNSLDETVVILLTCW